MMKYRGYVGNVEFDEDADLFHGEVIGMRDVITFQGRSVDELRRAFRDSVDDYLAMCEEEDRDPDKPFSGKLLLRLTPELHRKASIAATKHKTSLNRWLVETIEAAV